MKLKFKKLTTEAVAPAPATDGSNGLDLTATAIIHAAEYTEMRTGICVEIPEGYVGLLFPRSSISNKNFMLANGVGVIDSDYRGEICFRFKVFDAQGSINKYAKMYQPGDRIGQLVVVPSPKVELEEVKDLSETERGEGGYGSTGK